MFPRTHWSKGFRFSPAELQSVEAKIHQALGGASKESWSFGEPPEYGLLNGLSEPGGECNRNRIRRKNLECWWLTNSVLKARCWKMAEDRLDPFLAER